ncbi:MAG: hypothetical protein ABQ298_11480 [Puniceicoccaceae bacterium]
MKMRFLPLIPAAKRWPRCSLLACLSLCTFAALHGNSPVELKWLETPELPSRGVTWGVPFAQGSVQPGQNFVLQSTDGGTHTLQSWPLAYWPDGSLKWKAFASVLPADSDASFSLHPTPEARNPAQSITVLPTESSVSIDTGVIQAVIPRRGPALIASLKRDKRQVLNDARLIILLQNGPDGFEGQAPNHSSFISEVEFVTVEQDGPMRALIRLEGTHKQQGGARKWLPFVVRLTFYAGQDSVDVVHTFTFDGEAEADFIRGIGLQCSVPLHESIPNRHVRFSGADGGIWAEPVQPLYGRFPIPGAGDLYTRQLAGESIPEASRFGSVGQQMFADWASWSDYKLTQPNANGFQIQKRMGSETVWLDAAQGTRSSGYAFVGEVSGGLAIAVRDFWQSHPSALEIRGATTAEATLTAWLWSPDAPAMDLRHYSTRAHGLRAAYEDVQAGFSTPYGIARTTELTLFATDSIPKPALAAKQAASVQHPRLLVTSPEYLHESGVFGVWSLPDSSNAQKRNFEAALAGALEHYQTEIDQRHWYGFWDYGDVMHGYDPHRHMWRYDIGGYAWANAELVPNMWLWYSFLRTGDPAVYRMAEAMTRHVGEVDSYHIGRFQGLGTRHNVRHWGDGAKEARVSQAALQRFYYYLTADERTGDLMRAVRDADQSLLRLDPLRIAMPIERFPTTAAARIRVGPDWLAFVGNWMTEWERTGDPSYRDKILAGMTSLAEFEHGLFSGPGVFGYDPETGAMINDIPGPSHHTAHLVSIMGGAEVMFELLELVDHPEFEQAWLDYCRHYNRQTPEGIGGGNFPHWHARLTAYAAMKTSDAALAEAAWRELGAVQPMQTQHITPPQSLQPIEEVPGISTNSTSQNLLNLIQLLEMVGHSIPSDLEARKIIPE